MKVKREACALAGVDASTASCQMLIYSALQIVLTMESATTSDVVENHGT